MDGRAVCEDRAASAHYLRKVHVIWHACCGPSFACSVSALVETRNGYDATIAGGLFRNISKFAARENGAIADAG